MPPIFTYFGFPTPQFLRGVVVHSYVTSFVCSVNSCRQVFDKLSISVFAFLEIFFSLLPVGYIAQGGQKSNDLAIAEAWSINSVQTSISSFVRKFDPIIYGMTLQCLINMILYFLEDIHS